jgi:hypothetical protein
VSIGILVPSWTAMLQHPAATPSDSVVVVSPLPGGVAAVTRFLLNAVPPWVQIGGLVVAAVVAAFVVGYFVKHRQTIRSWLASRSRGVALALGAGALLLTAGVVGMGAATWNYTQHSNEFCTGCHVMEPSFQKFGNSENKHAELSCHDCHQQSIYASARQLYLWVKERPEEIDAHAKVPNRVCETCHVTGDTARWQRVASTAGHRVHLQSDSSSLRNLQCVTCHGQEVHRFKPVSGTCGQSGCHDQTETNIVLGKMATQTVRHCTSCHAFTADVPALATRDSARGTLVPGQPQCLGCHEMQRVLGDFDAAKDPHGGKCGTCHNPHEQRKPADALATCTTSGCHSNWRDEPFHVGASHRRVAQRCETCHQPHQARVDASNCAGCHASVRERGIARPPLPFDTTRALRRTSLTTPPAGHTILPTGLPAPPPPGALMVAVYGFTGNAPNDPLPTDTDARPTRASWPAPAADSFSHPRHAKLACLVCHQTGAARTRLTFERPRGCTICHHQAPAASRCASCHQPDEVNAPQAVAVAITVPGHQPVSRPVDFLHARHADRTCTQCHTTPVSLAPPAPIAQCKDCHAEHHEADRTCTACHAPGDPKRGHPSLEAAHQRCDACHTPTTVARLTPTRSFCATCHMQRATNHYDQKECTTCHFLAEPGSYRSKLITPPR